MSQFKEDKKIEDLDLHECKTIYDGFVFTYAMKVTGGWIYTSMDKEHMIMAKVFVPETKENNNE